MIELTNISKIYKAGKFEVPALLDVSLSIAPGEFVAIMGPSGSGKSTLMNILGFLDRPESGEYRFLGQDITRFSDDELSFVRNRFAGFVFQKYYLLPRMSALQNVTLPLIYSGSEIDKQRAREKIARVGLSERETHAPNELSGGEQQRIAIARSLINDPQVIFADEPTGNLDSHRAAEIMAILKSLNDSGKTIIMVTHELDMAQMAKRIITIRDGRIESDTVVAKNRSRSRSALAAPAMPTHRGQRTPGFGRLELGNYLGQAIGSLVSHKMRSFLSMLGILIGVASVISMLALGEGARESITSTLSTLGTNLLTLSPGSHKQHGIALEAGKVTRFTIQDAEAISRLPEVRMVCPSVAGQAQLEFGNQNWNSQLQGAGTNYEQIRAMNPVVGRFFTEEEVHTRKRVALVGPTVLRELFKNQNPVGKTIKINRIYFRVIGVLPSKGTGFGRDRDDVVLIPITTAMYRVLGKVYIDFIDIEIKDQSVMEGAKASIINIIMHRHRIPEDNRDTFFIRDMSEIRDALMSTTKTMSWLLGMVSAISLVVGGIGIMNIMLVSVKERTNEIGLRKAIGARKIDIRIQFLIESALMTFAGGLAGITLGSLISVMMSLLAGWAVKISLFGILLSVLFSILIGISFGFWPAVQASKLNPIEALRYE